MDYLKINKELWNERTKHHLESEFYDVQGFLNGKTSLNQIELDLLGDISGKKILHLQCHFGQDSLSLARMGADVTGIDLSDAAINAAVDLAKRMKVEANFICCNIYDLPLHLSEQFDLVYTTYGTIGWLPDLDKWGALISRYLKPGGSLVFAEFHPVVWMFDNDFTYVQYSYFNTEAIVEQEEGTYADKDAPIKLASVGWNHPLDEVFRGLLGSGLTLVSFQEYDYSPYNIIKNMIENAPGRFQIAGMEGKVPLVYSLRAVKG